ncbi:MAG: hypothetical protein WB622_01605 [Acidobacteriaceae bacterium]|jgi:hypothetical protein
MTRFASFVLLLPTAFIPSALAVTITTPGNNAQVTSPISLAASADTCSSQPVTAMGYSLDSETDTTMVDKTSLNAQIPASTGKHTIHVKAWNTQGEVCVEDVTVDVTTATASSDPPATSALSAPPATAAATEVSTQGITVSSPYSGTSHTSPFTLTASASSCQSKTITNMGYSLDSGGTTMVDSSRIGATVSAATGSHTVHVKAWGTGGVVCTAAVSITITGSSQGATTSSGGITVSSPENGSSVSSPFSLVAKAGTCSGQAVTSLGYSLDNSSDTTLINGTSVDTQVTAASGGHTLHVKSWGKSGASCSDSLSITVAGTTATSDAVSAPSDATKVSSVQTLSGWTAAHDTGMGGSASGSTAVVTSPTLSGHARKFSASWSNSGGERYSKSFGDNRTSTNFLYDGWVYISSSSGSIANIEMDLNQTMPSGNTVIFGFQCDGYKGKWDYSENTGSAAKPVGKWVSTSVACNPASWSRNAWHHVQIEYSRATSGGNITYKSVTLDGTTHAINKTAFNARSLGWGSSIVTNFQIDGRGSGSATVYLDKLTVSRW